MRLSDSESDSFGFFIQQTVHEISGCFRSDLWERLLLQIIHHEPAIFHAATAVGAMHLYRKQTRRLHDSPQQALEFAVKQYLKASSQLRDRLGNTRNPPPTEVTLTACLLFICLDTMRHKYPGVQAHLKGGLQILQGGFSDQFEDESSSSVIPLKKEPSSLIDHLAFVFARLKRDSMLFGNGLVPIQFRWPNTLDSFENNATAFSSTEEARSYLDQLSMCTWQLRNDFAAMAAEQVQSPSTEHWAVHSYKIYAVSRTLDLSSHPWLLFQLNKLRVASSRFASALAGLRDQKQDISPEHARAIDLLEIQHLLPKHWLAKCLDMYANVNNCFDDEFQRIIVLVERYISSQSQISEAHEPKFNLETGVLPTLYLIGSASKSPSLRQKAISLLQTCSFQEGINVASQMGRVIRELAALEEASNECHAAGFPKERRTVLDLVNVPGEDIKIRLLCASFRIEAGGNMCF